MHKEKVLRMSQRNFFYQEHKRNIFFGNFSWMLIFENTSNANLLFSGNQSSPFPKKIQFLKRK
jgi:hypothetical protein